MAQDNVDVIQGAWDAFGRGDIDGAHEASLPRRARSAAPESLPWGGTYAGPEGSATSSRALLEHFKDFKATPEKVLGADDDHVIVTREDRGRTKAGGTVEGTVGLDLQAARRPGRRAPRASRDTAQVLEALELRASS